MLPASEQELAEPALAVPIEEEALQAKEQEQEQEQVEEQRTVEPEQPRPRPVSTPRSKEAREEGEL